VSLRSQERGWAGLYYHCTGCGVRVKSVNLSGVCQHCVGEYELQQFQRGRIDHPPKQPPTTVDPSISDDGPAFSKEE
jgi:hypothetical protein